MTITIQKAALAGLASLVSLAVAASAASAVTIHPTDGTAPFAGSSAGTQTLTVKGGAGVVRATGATYNGTTSTPTPDTHAYVSPVWTGATLALAGVIYPATVAHSGAWDVSLATSLSPFFFGVTTGSVTITSPPPLTGAITITPQGSFSPTPLANAGTNLSMPLTLTGLQWTATGNLATFLGSTSGSDGRYVTGTPTVSVTGVNVS